MAGRTRVPAYSQNDRIQTSLYLKKDLCDALTSAAEKLKLSRSFVAGELFDRLCTGITAEKVAEIVLAQIAARAKGA